jgi:peptidoglycan/LPS O-acetylase OafA/YrhL
VTLDLRRQPEPILTRLFVGGDPERVALVADGGTLTYGELANVVTTVAGRLGPVRRLVLLEAANDVPTVVTYLAALTGGHAVLLVGPGDAARHEELVGTYDPDVVQTSDSGRLLERRPGSAHDLHPELALLLSTSGSTGSPKLVRLSRTNLVANATAIVDYVHLGPDDRAITSLPLHYCYGLSVLHSHLQAGASVVLTDLSVADECFWDLVTTHGVTGVAGVPYSFELLDASGFPSRELPTLRYLTQAGGRMPADRVRAYAELGRERGWELFVMYGQTEATARMAYLPPDRAAERPTSIGIPIPGGDFHLEPAQVDEPGVGELVYTGPNVMMGYAHDAADLARGPELSELRTGDLGRQADDGLWEVVGRLNRFGKVFGVRLDLDRLEEQLAAEEYDGSVVVVDERLHVFTTRPRTRDRVRQALARFAGIPVGSVRVHVVETLPLTPKHKPDHGALARHAALVGEPSTQADGSPATAASLRDLYATLLGRPDATTSDSFVSLGGDSLSFVEVSLRLGRVLGHLPQGWQHLSVETLAGTARRRRRRVLAPMESAVLLRAVAIVLVVLTHTDWVLVPGGAHVLLAVMGFNLARFALPVPGRRRRVRRLLGTAAAVAVPAAVWIGACSLVAGTYQPATAVFLNQVVGGNSWSDDWQFWFLEALVWTHLGLAVLLLVPALDRLQRRHTFAAAMLVLAATLGVRYLWTGVEAGATERYTVGLVLWCLALGWAAAESRTTTQRLAVSGCVLVATVGFFGDLQREALVAGAVLLLVWVRSVPVPAVAARVLGLVGSASLWIYLTHWQVYPGLEAAGHQFWALVASLVLGVACWAGYERAAAVLRARARAGR